MVWHCLLSTSQGRLHPGDRGQYGHRAHHRAAMVFPHEHIFALVIVAQLAQTVQLRLNSRTAQSVSGLSNLIQCFMPIHYQVFRRTGARRYFLLAPPHAVQALNMFHKPALVTAMPHAPSALSRTPQPVAQTVKI